MDISPASALQVMDSGELIEISDDILGVARDLREIDPNLRLMLSERHGHFTVYQRITHPITGELLRNQVVTTCQPPLMPAALLERVRMVTRDNYDLAAESLKAHKEAKRKKEHELHEAMGPGLERLAHALRKDFHLDQRRIFVPGGLPA